ncbi:Putative Isoflavone reductase family protein [Penicillium brasilianum]|uniref:Putative Isoflavone reductase family protein n=1 Tax=Penicillium brasilianum TaxID=104259 RepID=A0A0F7TVZ7_PENBI|nr:Putative Isoflavone reductase family protein [Penicillium brasilianum]
MAKTQVLLVGAAGETGGSIANGLIEDGSFDVHALVRPISVHKPAIQKLQERGIQIRKGDLKASEEQLIEVLAEIDVVISCVGPAEQQDQIPLAKAAKKCGVKRFIPCGFITVAPPGGVMWLRDEKEIVYNQIRQLWLPYTIVDVGWWYQLSYPRLLSGRVDYAMTSGNDEIIGDGNMPTALTDLRDIGRYMALIINDPRTLNKKILAYNLVSTQNQIYSLMEEISEEKVDRNYVSEETICSRVLAARQASETYPFDPIKFIPRYLAEYQYSWGIRGDNNPEYARYLGYHLTPELYPEFKPTDFREYLESVVRGTAKGVYQDRVISRKHQRHFPRTESSDSLYTRIFPRTESSDSLMSR